EQSVRARLWEDPVAAVQRGMREVQPPAVGFPKPAHSRSGESSLNQRLKPLRLAIADRVKKGERITVLLVTMSGDPYAESVESRRCHQPRILGHPDLVVADPGVRRVETEKRMPPDRRPAQVGPSKSGAATGRHIQAGRAPQLFRPA